MKKVILIAMGITATVALTSCDKLSEYCAECTEAFTGYTPSDFCGTEAQVDAYIRELKSAGSAVGQSWSCTKYRN